ncbi:uncharacterized protein [Engystomops pustulosus]|uniref:uncharacterized protein n=1 Tax=Engystomops pustulosus TaxID=76066 RepID=UPI003AFB3017
MAHIAMERLISLVEERPLIWDKRVEEYADRGAKYRAWQEITSLMVPDEWKNANPRRREELVESINKRWCSARDQYRREKNAKAKSGSGSLGKRPYMYSRSLGFLDSVMEVGTTTDNLEESLETRSSEDPTSQTVDEVPRTEEQVPTVPADTDQPAAETIFRIPTRRNRRRRDPESDLRNMCSQEIFEQLRQRREETPDDVFCRALVADLQSVPPEMKMSCKSALLGVVQVCNNVGYNIQDMCQNIEHHRQRVAGFQPPAPLPASVRPSMPAPPAPAAPPAPHAHHYAWPSTYGYESGHYTNVPSHSQGSSSGPFTRDLMDI